MRGKFFAALFVMLASTQSNAQRQPDRTDSFVVEDIQVIATNEQMLRIKGRVTFRDHAGQRGRSLGMANLVLHGSYIDRCVTLAAATGQAGRFVVRVQENSWDYNWGPGADTVVVNQAHLKSCVVQRGED